MKIKVKWLVTALVALLLIGPAGWGVLAVAQSSEKA